MSPGLLSLAPSVIAIVAAGVAFKVRPSVRFRSTAQHLAAGVVFAAVALELLPDIMQRRAIVPTAIGFAVGVAFLLALRAFEKQLCQIVQSRVIAQLCNCDCGRSSH